MASSLFNQASLVSDSGFLKNDQKEWQGLQNFRGWGNRISRRRGIRNSVVLSSGVMGIHDLSIDGDPTSPEKIIVTLHNGDIVVLNYSEIYISFTFLFASGIRLILQSPDLNWWNVSPDTNGTINPVVVSAPSTTISSDLNILQNQLFGFTFTTNVIALNINTSGNIITTGYGLTGGEIQYSTDQAFTSGTGPVFNDTLGIRKRLSVDNSGVLITTAI